MVLQERQRGDTAAVAVDGHRMAGNDAMLIGDRRIAAAGLRDEAIVEAVKHHPRGRLVEVHVETAFLMDEKAAQIVDAVGVVGMLVGDEHGIEPVRVGGQQLFAQVRRRVDQYARLAVVARLLDQN